MPAGSSSESPARSPGPITASSAVPLNRLRADSLCVHGDNPESLAVLRRLRAQLDAL